MGRTEDGNLPEYSSLRVDGFLYKMINSRKTIYFISGLILLFAGAITTSSPYNQQSALISTLCVAAGLLVGQLVCFFSFKLNLGWIKQPAYLMLVVGMAAQFIALTAHAIAAGHLPNPNPTFFQIPGREVLYYGLAFGYAALLVGLLSRLGEKGIYWGAMSGAVLASSTVYLRTFVTPEIGPVYGPAFSMALVALVYLIFNQSRKISSLIDESPFNIKKKLIFQIKQVSFWIIAFLILSGISAVFSPAPGETIDYWLRMAITFMLAIFLALGLEQAWEWRYISWIVVFTSGLIGLFFAILSLVVNSSIYGFPYALTARFHPTEFGGANLIARSILIVIPLGVWLIINIKHLPIQIKKLIALSFLILSLAVLLLSHSWEGVFAYLAELLVLFGIYLWVRYRQKVQSWFLNKTRVSAILVLGCALAGVSIIFLFRFASVINTTSYNGRLIHWKAALLSFLDAPVFGGGLGYSAQFTPYGDQIEFSATSLKTLSDPIFVNEITNDYLTFHSHQLFLEVLSGTGLIGFIPFLGVIILVLLKGFYRPPSLSKELARLHNGAILGIIGAISWGMLDVLQAMPLFVGGNLWVLLGLLLVGENNIISFQTVREQGKKPASIKGMALVVLFAGILIVIPAVRSHYYTQGYSAYQQRRYNSALVNFRSSVALDPLNAKNWADVGATEINLENYIAAEQAYQFATRYSPNQSHYLTTLGLLNWYLRKYSVAEENLRKATEVDPRASWNTSIWENLALFSSNRGNFEDAYNYFLYSIYLNPALGKNDVWVWSNNSFDEPVLSLNRYYLEDGEELAKLLKLRMGFTNQDQRNLAYPDHASESYSLTALLDHGLREYNALAEGEKTPLRLASLIEFSLLAGANEWAMDANQQYLDEYPKSVYGYRSQASLFQRLGCVVCAIDELQIAQQISPNDFNTRSQYIRTLLDEGQIDVANSLFSDLYKYELYKPFRYYLVSDEYFRLARDIASMMVGADELRAQKQLTQSQGNPSDYLALSEIQSQNVEQSDAKQSCIQGVTKLIWLNYDPYDEILKIGAHCLTRTNIELEELAKQLPASENPYLFSIILGMVAMERGQLDKAQNWFSDAVAIDPKLGYAYTKLGLVHRAMNNLINARLEFVRALSVDPWEPLPLMFLADMEFTESNWEAGLDYLERMVYITPSWDEAQIALGNFYLKSGNFSQADPHFKLARQISGGFDPGYKVDFASSLANAKLTENVADGYIKTGIYEIDGVWKFSIFMHPVSSASYPLTMPDIPAGSILQLEFSLGMLPDSWSQAGDGVNFAVDLRTTSQTVEIYSAYIDPKHNPQDRLWQQAQVDLSAYAGQEVTLTLRTDGGEAGDLQFDWACWGEPVLAIR